MPQIDISGHVTTDLFKFFKHIHFNYSALKKSTLLFQKSKSKGATTQNITFSIYGRLNSESRWLKLTYTEEHICSSHKINYVFIHPYANSGT